jgi:hypothetical protein
LNERIIEIKENLIKRKLNKLLKAKGLGEKELEDVINKVIEKIKSKDCTTKAIGNINKIFGEYGLEIEFSDKDVIIEILNYNYERQEVELEKEIYLKLEGQ